MHLCNAEVFVHFKKTTNDQLDQEEPKKGDTVVLLEEIRDLLKTSKEDK